MVYKPELVYCGKQDKSQPDKWDVWRNGYPLGVGKSLEYVQLSLSGFTWGAAGPGAEQLAFALLLDCLKSWKAATKWHLPFARNVTARFPDQWVLTGAEIETWYWAARPDIILTERKIHAQKSN